MVVEVATDTRVCPLGGDQSLLDLKKKANLGEIHR
jgi:hypothetical protein